MAQGVCRIGRGMGWEGRELPSVGVTDPLAGLLYKLLQGGTTYLVPDASWVSVIFSVMMSFFFLFFFFLFKRGMTKTTWGVCLILDHFANPTMLSRAEQRQASRYRFLVMG